ncbi:hypothetical protein GCM10028784_16520 [Myceligenerans cantabricum]
MPLIPTSTSLAGHPAGNPRLQKSADRSRENKPPVAVDLVGVDDLTEVMHHCFRFGDWSPASGRLQTRWDGSWSFTVRRIGHDAVHVDHTARRTRTKAAYRRSEGDVLGNGLIVAGRILPDDAHNGATA